MVKMTWFYAIYSTLCNFKISWLSWEHHESSWISQLWSVLITILKITWNEVPLRKPYQGISGFSQIKIFEKSTKSIFCGKSILKSHQKFFWMIDKIKIWDVYWTFWKMVQFWKYLWWIFNCITRFDLANWTK